MPRTAVLYRRQAAYLENGVEVQWFNCTMSWINSGKKPSYLTSRMQMPESRADALGRAVSKRSVELMDALTLLSKVTRTLPAG